MTKPDPTPDQLREALNICIERALIAPSDLVEHHWPEFGTIGSPETTVADVLGGHFTSLSLRDDEIIATLIRRVDGRSARDFIRDELN